MARLFSSFMTRILLAKTTTLFAMHHAPTGNLRQGAAFTFSHRSLGLFAASKPRNTVCSHRKLQSRSNPWIPSIAARNSGRQSKVDSCGYRTSYWRGLANVSPGTRPLSSQHEPDIPSDDRDRSLASHDLCMIPPSPNMHSKVTELAIREIKRKVKATDVAIPYDPEGIQSMHGNGVATPPLSHLALSPETSS